MQLQVGSKTQGRKYDPGHDGDVPDPGDWATLGMDGLGLFILMATCVKHIDKSN